jgi:hypothetical protein
MQQSRWNDGEVRSKDHALPLACPPMEAGASKTDGHLIRFDPFLIAEFTWGTRATMPQSEAVCTRNVKASSRLSACE